MRDHQPVPLLHFRRKSRLRDQNDPPAILAGRFRRVVGAERAPGLPKRRVRTGTRLISYRMPQDSQFVRKQGVSRTGCLRPVSSYGNRAYPVPAASGQSFRTKTRRFSYRMKRYCIQNWKTQVLLKKAACSTTDRLREYIDYR